MHLPTAAEINPIPGFLEGPNAVAHFLNKNLEEAEALFRQSSLIYQEDLMFMGPVAFRFYVQAAINYIRSEDSTGDADMISCFAAILEHRLEFEGAELVVIARQLASICAYMVQHYDRFDLQQESYGDIRPRLEVLRQAFLRQTSTLS